jgi:hypothetical protein
MTPLLGGCTKPAERRVQVVPRRGQLIPLEATDERAPACLVEISAPTVHQSSCDVDEVASVDEVAPVAPFHDIPDEVMVNEVVGVEEHHIRPSFTHHLAKPGCGEAALTGLVASALPRVRRPREGHCPNVDVCLRDVPEIRFFVTCHEDNRAVATRGRAGRSDRAAQIILDPPPVGGGAPRLEGYREGELHRRRKVGHESSRASHTGPSCLRREPGARSWPRRAERGGRSYPFGGVRDTDTLEDTKWFRRRR